MAEAKELLVNLGLIQEYAPCDPFVDLMLSGRGAEVVPYSGGSHQKAKEDYDGDGWQKSLTAGVDKAKYYWATNGNKARPAGSYVVLYDPGTWAGFTTAQVRITGATIDSHVSGRIEITWDGSSLASVEVRPTSADMTAADYVKNIQILHADDEASYDRSKNIWRQEFLTWADTFDCFRFMDWGQTNNSYIVDWADRPGVNTQSCSRWLYDTDFPTIKRHLGVPDEWMIDLCNRLAKNAWVCIPHRATDAYVTSKATLWRDTFWAGGKIRVEYSNECWNGTFRQQAYREDLRVAYGLPNTNEGRHAAYATRSAECFELWDAVFAGQLGRRVRVLAGQSGNATTATHIAGGDVSTGTTLTGVGADYADVYATAPYIARNVQEATKEAAYAAALADIDVILDPVTGEVKATQDKLALLSKVLPIEFYECGIHLVKGGVMTEAVVTDTNRMPEMRGLICSYLKKLHAQGKGAMAGYFNSHFVPSASGAWGLLENVPASLLPPGPSNYKWYGYLDFVASLATETMPTKFSEAANLFTLPINADIDTDHASIAVHPGTGDVAVIYSEVGAPRIVKARIFRRTTPWGAASPRWAPSQEFILGHPGLDIWGAAQDSCENPWIAPIDDGFAAFWIRRDNTVGNTTMTIGVQLEMAKLKDDGGRYVKFAAATKGKGYVLDNQIINGDAGCTPRACGMGGNVAAVVYSHQTSYALNAGIHEREVDVRGAYLDFTPDDKPSMVSNRTGGSVSDATDGGYPAGGSTFLPGGNGIRLRDEEATPVFANSGGCCLPYCAQAPNGNLLVTNESRPTGAGQGGIVMRMYKAPGRGNALDDAALHTSTTDFPAGATNAARRPVIAALPPANAVLDSVGSNYPSVLVTYGDQDPGSDNLTKAIAYKVDYPVDGDVTNPTVSAITIPTNTNYDAVQDKATFSFAVKTAFYGGIIVEELVSGSTASEGKKFKLIREDNDVEVWIPSNIPRGHRVNAQGAKLRDGSNVLMFAYEGTNSAGDSIPYLTGWLF